MTLTQINKAGLDEIALDHVFTIGASGTDHYTFQGEGLNGTVNDPTLYLTRGKTYRFENGTGAHPIRIQSTQGVSSAASDVYKRQVLVARITTPFKERVLTEQLMTCLLYTSPSPRDRG